MNMAKKVLWMVVSLAAAAAFAVVTGIVNPGEPVNALWIVVATGCIYAITYRFYGAFVAAKVMSVDEKRVTPAVRLNDGMDYEPTNRWVLFGHHFAAIAGAGPLIGPMLAAQFGYLPGFLWILIGSALAGSVHDMVTLAQIAKEEVGPVGGIAASLAILFIIIVALAGLGLAVINALTHSPWGTYTIAATIPIALLMGFYLKVLRPGKVGEMSVIGVVLLCFAVISGHYIPGSRLESFFNQPRETLVIVLAAYGFLASVLPVWMLLCPRDYLSTYMKIGTISLLALGIMALAPHVRMPAVTQFVDGGGPIIPGRLFPFMFITIACGAISGFHALISSGTTPKMISSEKDIRMIGFGAMLTEGFVSMMALIAATVLIPGDYFAINTKLSLDQLAALGFPAQRIQELSAMVGVDVAHRPGGAVSLAVGMSSIIGNIPGLKGLMPYWYNFALMFEALFILTTVDAGTRVARFLLQEFGGHLYKPLARQSWLPGNIAMSLLVVLAWGYLIHSGSVSTIWPMFGVSNQLLAAIALGVGTTIIIRENKLRYAWVTLAPMLFMFTTTFTASWQLIGIFRRQAAQAVSAADAFTFRMDIFLVALMALLAVVALADMLRRWYRVLAGAAPAATAPLSTPE
jgi:carbon starvation protein